jgi:hypothetical protein
MCLDVDRILSSAEGIYHQIISAPHLTDQIRVILGLPTVNTSTSTTSDPEEPTTSHKDHENGTSDANGISMYNGKDMEEVMYQIGLDMNF